jgi:hypothetical protein
MVLQVRVAATVAVTMLTQVEAANLALDIVAFEFNKSLK